MLLWRERLDVAVAGTAALTIGAAFTIAFTAAGMNAPPVIGAVAVAAGLGGLAVLVAGGWISGIAVVAAAIPLPALAANADVRIAAVAPITLAVVAGWLLAMRLPDARADRLVTRSTHALLAVFFVATLSAAAPATSARELFNITVLLAFFLLAVRHAAAPGAADAAVTLLAAVAALCGALAVLEAVGILPGNFPRWGTPFNRAALGFGQPNGLGLFLAVLLPVSVHAMRAASGWRRTLAVVALCAVTAGLFATFSRGSWLAVIGGACALAFVRDYRLLRNVMLSALVSAVALDVISGGMLRDTIARTAGDWVLEQRAALMIAGISMFLANPVLGVGPGGFEDALPSYGAQIPQLWDYLPTPHNAYIQMAAETGVAGLVVFVVFLGVCMHRLVRYANNAAAVGANAVDVSLRRCLVWSFATSCCAGIVVWPFAHGTGQAVLLLLAVGLARPVD